MHYIRQVSEVADTLWERHALLKTGLSARTHTQTDRHTDKQTKVKTAYPPVSLRSLGVYKIVAAVAAVCEH